MHIELLQEGGYVIALLDFGEKEIAVQGKTLSEALRRMAKTIEVFGLLAIQNTKD